VYSKIFRFMDIFVPISPVKKQYTLAELIMKIIFKHKLNDF